MTRELMYDATPGGVDAIPADAKAVAGYIDGLYQSFPLLLRRFGATARVVSIGVNIGNLAEWSDVEPGNAIITPALVRADFLHKTAHKVWKPGYYADLTRMLNVVIPGLSGIPRSEYRLWLADWDGNENSIPLPGGVELAKQFRNVGPYDESVILNVEEFFGLHHRKHHPAPKPTPKPTPKPRPLPKPSPKPPKPPEPQPKPRPKPVHVGSGGALGTALIAFLASEGVHLTTTESGLIVAAVAFLASLTPATVRRVKLRRKVR